MKIQIPGSGLKRIVIIGGGFAGLSLASKLMHEKFQVVLIDKNNYHQFQPLLYQVASAGLELDSISFPFRKLFDKKKDFYFRLAEVRNIFPAEKRIETSIGTLEYDYLVIATGTTTNYYGNDRMKEVAIPMKSVEESIRLRNRLLLNFEKALDSNTEAERNSLLNVVIVGGGATGVEIAGALAEMRRYVIPNDYPDLQGKNINIYLIEGTDKLLGVMSEDASANALKSLQEMGVNVWLGKRVTGYENNEVMMDTGEKIPTQTLVWVSGVIANKLGNFPDELYGRGARLKVNAFNQLTGYDNIFVIGDCCLQFEEKYPNGHPQVAPVAIQQGRLLARNLRRLSRDEPLEAFHYKNQGTLATIGRNKAVADLGRFRLHGFPAWAVWMLVHLRSILGVRNRILVLVNWVWNYITYDQSRRFILFTDQSVHNVDGTVGDAGK